MDVTPAELRHSIRGAFNALKLCVSAFEMPLEPSEKLEFLSDIESSAVRIATLLEQYGNITPDLNAVESTAAAGAVAVHVR